MRLSATTGPAATITPAGTTAPRAGWIVTLSRLYPLWLGISRQVRPRPFTGQCTVGKAYADRFVDSHSDDIAGRVLEIRESLYSSRHPRLVKTVEILDLDSSLEGVTVAADLSDMPHVPDDHFDVAIVTQTLQYVFDLHGAVEELHRVIVPGGVLLLTVPAAERASVPYRLSSDLWRFTGSSVRRLLAPFANVEVEEFGNCLAAIAEYRGVPARRIGNKLWRRHPQFPVLVAARAVKGTRPPGRSDRGQRCRSWL